MPYFVRSAERTGAGEASGRIAEIDTCRRCHDSRSHVPCGLAVRTGRVVVLTWGATVMKRLFALLSLMLLLAGLVSRPSAAQERRVQPDRPNFLIIVADDLGFSDIGAFGGEIATPNLDALAARGMKFTGLHSSPTCSPTRAMLLTGLDNHEAGLGTMAEVLAPNQVGKPGYEGFLRPDTATLAEMLGAAGYRTMFAGKWHLGLTREQAPSRRGFQSSFALLQASHNHFGRRLSTDPKQGFVYRENGEIVTSLPDDFYSSDYFATKLIEQLRQGKTSPARPRPFFAYLAFSAPHWPLQAPAETISKYRGRYDAGYEALARERLDRQVELGLLDSKAVAHGFDLAPPWNSLTSVEKAAASRRMEIYAAMVDRLDQNVGRVLDELRRTGELDNTFVLFLSDNGADWMTLASGGVSKGASARLASADNSLANLGTATSFVSNGPGWAEAVNAPSWRAKGFETEGGTRVVSFLAGPGIRHRITPAFASVMDVAPTLLELAGVPRPAGEFAGRKVKTIRGRSWVPLISGESDCIYPADQPVGAELLGMGALRQSTWKLVDAGDGTMRLFNVARDPGETTDLSASEPGRKAMLENAWKDYAEQVGVIPPDPPIRILPVRNED